MISYLAVKDGTGIYLSRSKQMDEMLSKGFDIYEVYDDDNRILIATSKDGFLVGRPIIEQIGTANIG